MKYFLVACMALALSACGGNGSILGGYLVDVENPQARAGFNETLVEWRVVETEEGKQEMQIKRLHLVNGQESTELSFEMALSDGTIYKFEAGEIRAFEAFSTRAEVEQAIAEQLGDLATPELVTSIVNRLLGEGGDP